MRKYHKLYDRKSAPKKKVAKKKVGRRRNVAPFKTRKGDVVGDWEVEDTTHLDRVVDLREGIPFGFGGMEDLIAHGDATVYDLQVASLLHSDGRTSLFVWSYVPSGPFAPRSVGSRKYAYYHNGELKFLRAGDLGPVTARQWGLDNAIKRAVRAVSMSENPRGSRKPAAKRNPHRGVSDETVISRADATKSQARELGPMGTRVLQMSIDDVETLADPQEYEFIIAEFRSQYPGWEVGDFQLLLTKLREANPPKKKPTRKKKAKKKTTRKKKVTSKKKSDEPTIGKPTKGKPIHIRVPNRPDYQVRVSYGGKEKGKDVYYAHMIDASGTVIDGEKKGRLGPYLDPDDAGRMGQVLIATISGADDAIKASKNPASHKKLAADTRRAFARKNGILADIAGEGTLLGGVVGGLGVTDPTAGVSQITPDKDLQALASLPSNDPGASFRLGYYYGVIRGFDYCRWCVDPRGYWERFKFRREFRQHLIDASNQLAKDALGGKIPQGGRIQRARRG